MTIDDLKVAEAEEARLQAEIDKGIAEQKALADKRAALEAKQGELDQRQSIIALELEKGAAALRAIEREQLLAGERERLLAPVLWGAQGDVRRIKQQLNPI